MRCKRCTASCCHVNDPSSFFVLLFLFASISSQLIGDNLVSLQWESTHLIFPCSFSTRPILVPDTTLTSAILVCLTAHQRSSHRIASTSRPLDGFRHHPVSVIIGQVQGRSSLASDEPFFASTPSPRAMRRFFLIFILKLAGLPVLVADNSRPSQSPAHRNAALVLTRTSNQMHAGCSAQNGRCVEVVLAMAAVVLFWSWSCWK